MNIPRTRLIVALLCGLVVLAVAIDAINHPTPGTYRTMTPNASPTPKAK
jgi:hypothetical protein